MSVYIKCPSCGRLLADKEIKYEEGIKKINNEVLSQLLYSPFNKLDEATKHYNKLEKYIIDFDLEGIVKEINN